MAVGSVADVVLNKPHVHTGLVKSIPLNIERFYAATAGMIRLSDTRYHGQFTDTISFDDFSGFTTRRNSASTSAANAADIKKPVEINEKSVKLDRKTLMQIQDDMLRKSTLQFEGDEEQMEAFFAGAVAMANLQKQVNDSVNSLVAAISGQTALVNDTTVAPTRDGLNVTMGLFGDRRSRIVGWIMSGASETKLITESLGVEIEAVGGVASRQGTPATLGLPYVVIDDPALTVTSGTGTAAVTDYYILGLTADAAIVTNSQEYRYNQYPVPNQENYTLESRLEGSHNLMIKGYAWDETNGGVNPTDATLGTSTNWDKVVSSLKNTAGVLYVHR